jgi:hypothetical protein
MHLSCRGKSVQVYGQGSYIEYSCHLLAIVEPFLRTAEGRVIHIHNIIGIDAGIGRRHHLLELIIG